MLTPVPTLAGAEFARKDVAGATAGVLRSARAEIALDAVLPGATGVHHLFGRLPASVPVDLPARERAVTPALEEGFTEADGCGFAVRDAAGEAYNEAAFHYFLGVEHRRAQVAGRPMLMLFLELEHQRGRTPRMKSRTARQLFSVLLRALRETDFVGWYRDGEVIGAVLTQHADPSPVDLASVVRGRLTRSFAHELASDDVQRLRLRIYAVSPEADTKDA
jgi:hypothetical protein